MRKLLRFAGALALAALLGAEAQARYRFDDLYGPSGVGAQWMVITGGRDTVGNRWEQPLDASGDIVSGRYSVEVWNGRSTDELNSDSNRDIAAMFWVMQERQGTLTVNFISTAHDIGSVSEDAIMTDVLVGESIAPHYSVMKSSLGAPATKTVGIPPYLYTYTDRWRQYQFLFVKNQDGYGSVRTNFIFHQNPSGARPSIPSQTLEVPFVVANVYNGLARDVPLILRATLRDNQRTGNRGDIVAFDRFEWNVASDMTAGQRQWVFVPVDAWPLDSERIYYQLTTDVTNRTAVRYAVQRYDSYPWNAMNPIWWKFDLPRTPDLGDLANPFYLDSLSHIAPGLTAVYRQRYNINEGEKTPLRLYPVDPASDFRTLTLNHRIIFGLDRGTVTGPTSRPNAAAPYSVTAFNPRTANPEIAFLEAVARQMNAFDPNLGLRQILIPTGSGFLNTSSVVDGEYVAGDVIRSFAVRRAIPASLRGAGTEGMLPLHVTFNLPRTHLQVAQYWPDLLREWYETGDIHDLFARNFSIYLLSRREGERDNPWDMIQELIRQDAYHDQVKIFMDEDREVITVSFIVMLMDGTRDRVRPALYLVDDQTVTTNNTFMIVRDGWLDDEWNLTFYAAPAGYPNDDKPVSPDIRPVEKGGGGGCDAGLGLCGAALLSLAGLGLSRRKGVCR